MKVALALGILVPLVAGCAPTPKLLRHYETFANEVKPQEALKLSVFPANSKAAEDQPLILQLTERAQAELIRAAAANVGKGGNDALMALLTTPTEAPAAPCAWSKKTSMTKRLVFTVLGDLPTPADRIDKLDILLTLPPAQAGRAEFTSWDRFTSTYGDFNIGTAKFTQSNKFTAGAGGTSTNTAADATGGLEKVLNLGYEKTNSLDESASYAMRRLTVGGELTPSTARLVQEGAPNITLFGSSVAVITFKLTASTSPHTAYAFSLKDGEKFNPAEKVKVERCRDVYPEKNDAIVATVVGKALVREVRAGGSTVSEGDDDAVMRGRDMAGQNVTLASNSELLVERFGLAQCSAGATMAQCSIVHIEQDGPALGAVERVLVASFDAAAQLRNWLVDQATPAKPVSAIGGRRLWLRQVVSEDAPKPITSEAASKLQVVLLATNVPAAK